MSLPLFPQLELETHSLCNRRCPACLRECHPDREAVRPWAEGKDFMPTSLVRRLLSEASSLGCRSVCLQHYCEPLLDPRLPYFGRAAQDLDYEQVFACTNGDHLTPELARDLDGVFTLLIVALYGQGQPEREARLRGLFVRTLLQFTGGHHFPPHFGAVPTEPCLDRPCLEPARRMVVNHRGDMLLCCDDMVGNFGLGNVYGSSIRELWGSEAHERLVTTLREGRRVHPYCQACPRFRE